MSRFADPKLGAAIAAASGVLIVLALAIVADGYARHGVTASWYAKVGEERVLVDRTVEHRTTFPNVHRPLARYVQGWDFDAWGVPRELPGLDAVIEAQLEVPEGAPRYVRAQSPNAVELKIDGRPLVEGAVPPGSHALEVRWTGRFPWRQDQAQLADDVWLELEWGAAPRDFDKIPARALTPKDGSLTGLRVAIWIGALVASALTALLLFLGFRSRDVPVRRRWVGLLAAIFVVSLGVGYRAFDYDVMPDFRENGDELFATWNGWSLLTDGTPRGWSIWAHSYGGLVDREAFTYWGGDPWVIITPYFEHPPLLHLLVGAAAKIGGAAHWSHAKLSHTRIVPIALSAISLIFMIAIGRRLVPRSTGPYLGALLYAVLPVIALQTRVIKEEALLVPLSLASVWFYLRWRDDGFRTRDAIFAGLCAGLCTLAKVTGAFFVPAIVLLFASHRRWGTTAIVIAAGAFGVALLFVYGAIIDWETFWETTLKQAGGRPAHWNLFTRFLDDPLVNHNLIGRGHVLFLWVAFAGGVMGPARPRVLRVLTIVPVIYLLAIGISSGSWTFGWYIVPAYPFLCLGAGLFLANMLERPHLFGGFLLVAIAAMYGMNFLFDESFMKTPEAWARIRWWVVAYLAVLLTPFLLHEALRARATTWLARATTVACLVLIVGLSGWFIAHYDVLYDTYRGFDRNVYFGR